MASFPTKRTHTLLYLTCAVIQWCLCSLAMPKQVNKAKVACLDFSLQKAKMKLGVSVVVDDPEKLEAIRKRCVYAVMYSL